MEQLQLLHNSDIDLQKWDKCIDESINGRVYAQSWYLDIVCPDWHGVIYEDYKYIMPVCIGKKVGLKFVYQPLFTQQHGIFPQPPPDVINHFLQLIDSKFRFVLIQLNAQNTINNSRFKVIARNNYLLSLNKPHQILQENYSKHTKRYVKSSQAAFTAISTPSIDEYLKLLASHSKEKFRKKALTTIMQITSRAIYQGHGELLGAYTDHNELCAVTFFLKDHKRYIYMNPVSTSSGYEIRALFGLVDHFIQSHANENALLDLEGSMVKGIARFYAGFGALPEHYPLIYKNSYPAVVRWFTQRKTTI